MNKPNFSFENFLNFFPEIELPIQLNEETLSIFSKVNPPLPEPLVEKFVSKYDNTEMDEFTEYIPCFRIPDTGEFFAIVYWKAQLMNYEYHIVSYTKKGEFITGKVIGGLLSNGISLIKTVSSIDMDWIIHVVSGEDSVEQPSYSAENSKAYSLELLSTGDIIFSLNEDELSF